MEKKNTIYHKSFQTSVEYILNHSKYKLQHHSTITVLLLWYPATFKLFYPSISVVFKKR